MAELHLDQDVPPSSAIHLRHQGHTVVTARDLGMQQADDAEHLLHAAQHGRVLVTRDKGYRSLHLAWQIWSLHWRVQPPPEHAGIVIVDSHWPPQQVARDVDRLIQSGVPLRTVLYRFEHGQWVRY